MESPNASTHDLHAMIDYGTANLAVACQLLPKGSPPDPRYSKILNLQANKEEIPQTVGLAMEGDGVTIEWGHDLIHGLSTGRLSSSKLLILQRLKACLFDREQAAKVKLALEERFGLGHGGDRDAVWVMAEHLSKIRLAMMDAVRSNYRGLAADELDRMDVLTSFAVPEIATPGALR